MVRKDDAVPSPPNQVIANPHPSSSSSSPSPAVPSSSATAQERQEVPAIESDSEWGDSDSDIHVPEPDSRIAQKLPEPSKIHRSGVQPVQSADKFPAPPQIGTEVEAEEVHSRIGGQEAGSGDQTGILQLRSREGSWSEITQPPKEAITLQSHNPYLRLQHSGQSSSVQSNNEGWAETDTSRSELVPYKLPVEGGAEPGAGPPSFPPKVSASEQGPIILPIRDQATSQGLQSLPLPSLNQGFSSHFPGEPSTRLLSNDTEAPPLPPRVSQEERPPEKPPRPLIDTTRPDRAPSAAIEPTSPRERRKEHYQIKHIHWYDSSLGKLRPAPILIQNANGPCPLLALVNALVLSTPLNQETALIETLRTRERVSLGLLLDAVFDELMSERRGDPTQQLPDVGDLYAFLVTLHTGMNVNPRFVSKVGATTDIEGSYPRLSDPGSFEETQEMRLYGTFNMRLLHGWIPGRDDKNVFDAFHRSAQTYDDATNLQFREEELEHKLGASGLDSEEQQILQDISLIKDFLKRWPTQLTTHGLDVIGKALNPGEIAILFRNDHFSTLYKDMKSGAIFTLVTDAGYSSHDEVVWESLVDVNGQGSELFSGDFRPVGNHDNTQATRPRGEPSSSMLDAEGNHDNWQTVQYDRRSRRQSERFGENQSSQLPPAERQPVSGYALTGQQETGVLRQSGNSRPLAGQPATDGAHQLRTREEQEDHDLALALQLQEEEEEEQRREQAARRQREDTMSRQYLSSEQQRTGVSESQTVTPPTVPPRRHHQNTAADSGTRGNGDNGGSDEGPPPTYEQAASSRPWQPPRNHPASPHAPIPSETTGQRRQSAYAQQSSSNSSQPQFQQRRRSSRPGGLIDQIPDGSGYGRGRRDGPVGGAPYASGDRDKCTVQ